MTIELPERLALRRNQSDERRLELRSALVAKGASKLTANAACVYATGSVARGEASEHSDLDLFIVSRGQSFNRLKQIRLKATLIETSAAARFPEFSGDGEYLEVHSSKDLAGQIGSRDEDGRNLLTARLLLLLESKPILGDATYRATIESVVKEYWRDFEDHGREFQPIFLMNDIVRFWKVLCLNYEARTFKHPPRPEALARRRLVNYKLKFSRMLTCYSALASICLVFKQENSVDPTDMIEISGMTPLERLARIGEEHRPVKSLTHRLLDEYTGFLDTTAQPKAKLLKSFSRARFHETKRTEATQFGDQIFDLIQKVAERTPLLRYLVV